MFQYHEGLPMCKANKYSLEHQDARIDDKDVYYFTNNRQKAEKNNN